MAHTPGPWTAGPEDWLISKQHGCGYRQFPIRGKDYDIGNVFCDEDDDEQQANVRLIAAAPELLNALRDIVACAQMAGPVGTTAYLISDGRMQAAREAIATAEGKSA